MPRKYKSSRKYGKGKRKPRTTASKSGYKRKYGKRKPRANTGKTGVARRSIVTTRRTTGFVRETFLNSTVGIIQGGNFAKYPGPTSQYAYGVAGDTITFAGNDLNTMSNFVTYCKLYDFFRITNVEAVIKNTQARIFTHEPYAPGGDPALDTRIFPTAMNLWWWYDGDGTTSTDSTGWSDVVNLGVKSHMLGPGSEQKINIRPNSLSPVYTNAVALTAMQRNKPGIWLMTSAGGLSVPHYSLRLCLRATFNMANGTDISTANLVCPDIAITYRYTVEFKGRKPASEANVADLPADAAITGATHVEEIEGDP